METDIELLNAARARNEDALVKIFDLYSSALFGYASRLGCDPVRADHIVGDVFAKFLDLLSAGNGPKTNLRSYLYQMTYHMIIDQGRSSWKTAPLEAADLIRNDKHSVSPNLEDQMMLDVILKVIQNDLTDDQRHVIILRFMEGFSLKETAIILGKKVNHVKVIQNRAIAKLRNNL